MEGVKNLDVEILKGEERAGVDAVLAAVKPEWKSEEVIVKLLEGGHVNQNFICHRGDLEDAILVRIIGTSLSVLSRTGTEIKLRQLLSKIGLGPQLYCTFKNGLCTDFISGKVYPMKNSDIFSRDEALGSAVAKEMARLHHPRVLEEARAMGFNTKESTFVTCCQTLLDKWPKSFEDEEQNRRFLTEIPPLTQLQAELDFLRKIIEEDLSSTITLCHNDVHPDNVVCKEDTGEVAFIDYEAMGFNPYTFDLGTYLDYIATGWESDPEPLRHSKEFRVSWIKKYLHWKKEYGYLDEEITEAFVEEVYQQQEMMALAGHLHIGLIVIHMANALHNDPHPLDLFNHGLTRILYYFQMKDAVFANNLKEKHV